ncbi:hypothetical protein LV84_03428 [Algoriphagus ratkowskyi]|uniref:Uncharacterized protein n=1 Tax=Algoriphagus ratkowskyi TaxID=57028 RepID=A0A2W7SNV0_9BACT|nr:hypothetical protein [Algoriphagus ratkowskyi]PZX52422.1 hypothetical protein LV84_03428 [Algoriphagus ratkowskyi]TXD76230.1 hypothetical protein ESW18_17525 [Algoriphagus ratkowskyi]
METRTLLSVMTFPQRFDGKFLKVNIVLVPRNKNPFTPWPTGLPNPTTVPGFANLQPEILLSIVTGTDDFPLSNPTEPERKPIQRRVIYDQVPQKADVISMMEREVRVPVVDTIDKPKELLTTDKLNSSVKKYLPESYRNQFNFTQPRHKNAVTDDSYHCAIKAMEPAPNYIPRTSLSWGKVYAHILRQPLLAKACGMIYSVEIEIEDPSWFENGGYIYAEIGNPDYLQAQNLLLEHVDGPLFKRYAAKIPALTIGKERSLFAAVLFPVLYASAINPNPVPDGPWDELFMEAHLYNDGFAKIVHANQPFSGNLLKETQDELPPQFDAGIRIAWDDEQLLIWYIRQMMENPSLPNGNKKRLDVPLGVMGFHIDVKQSGVGYSWESLNEVQINEDENVFTGSTERKSIELPYQVYPNKISGPINSSYWLPMYYAKWIGKSMVTQDKDALEIYQNTSSSSRTMNGPKDLEGVKPNNTLIPKPLATQLRYGNSYEFRVRLADISGGGPTVKENPATVLKSADSIVAFRRYVPPGMLRIYKPKELRENDRTYFNGNKEETEFNGNAVMEIRRPLLEYPAVVFTDKYQKLGLDPIAMLKDLPVENGELKPALPDPDVQLVEVLVEVKSLRMDNRQSQNGRDSFITLYKTKRYFPKDLEAPLTIQTEFFDINTLTLGVSDNPFKTIGINSDEIHNTSLLLLPTCRHIRLSIRAVAEVENNPEDYFGFINSDVSKDSRYGKVQQLMFYKESTVENDLLIPFQNIRPLQALYFKPDQMPTTKQHQFSKLFRIEAERMQPGVVQRLASALGVQSKGMTLVARKGERIAFGCSAQIRHSLAPDGSSITFASKADLYHHWVICISHSLNRDWSYDALQDVAIVIKRSHKFRRDANSEWRQDTYLGDIELKHSASFEALQSDDLGQINRGYTRIIYIDALDPKNELNIGEENEAELQAASTAFLIENQNQFQTLLFSRQRYPDELWANYTIAPKFKKGHVQVNEVLLDEIKLPTVIPPSQIPKLSSVGLAFSPYQRTDDYSSSESRQRYLWVEFEQPIQNPDDTYFCRMLTNAPDQLIASNLEQQRVEPEESPLSLVQEEIRQIVPNQSDDKAGIGAMEQMIKSIDSDIHYILPIPPGLHSESPEMFGFFTYEFRVGHAHTGFLNGDSLWSTAQGRYGRPLRVTGIQHPVPSLLCTLNRTKDHLYVSSYFAKAVFNGKNVTARPPRTSLWALLYAQVHQADGLDYRNILLGEVKMKVGVNVISDEKEQKKMDLIFESTYYDTKLPEYIKGKFELNESIIKSSSIIASIKDSQPVGTTVITSQQIASWLNEFGLPEDSPLSILVVEVFGNITNVHDHIRDSYKEFSKRNIREAKQEDSNSRTGSGNISDSRSLSDQLGHFRILRTSPLTKVPFVCCPTCE